MAICRFYTITAILQRCNIHIADIAILWILTNQKKEPAECLGAPKLKKSLLMFVFSNAVAILWLHDCASLLLFFAKLSVCGWSELLCSLDIAPIIIMEIAMHISTVTIITVLCIAHFFNIIKPHKELLLKLDYRVKCHFCTRQKACMEDITLSWMWNEVKCTVECWW